MSLARSLCLAGVLGLAACGGRVDNSSMWTPLDEANLDSQPAQQCTAGQPDPRACAPGDAKKTTVCHIPPGNPANEHTICVGNAAVPAHLAHGDVLGSCCAQQTPPPDDMGNGQGGGGGAGNGGGGNGGGSGGGNGDDGGSGGASPDMMGGPIT